ncbi:MAG: ribonuclease BN (tRNA processing enzyme) [Psychromonas sp.]|jgi:ribonuclease BN (tRNA processing enzyme)
MSNKFKVDVIGCGNAYDSEHTNASIMVRENGFHLLIDCGPTVPAKIFSAGFSPESIDTIYLTHTHPDHCLGLTTLLNWMNAKKRRRPLTIIAQKAQWFMVDMLVSFAHWPQSSLDFDIKRQSTKSTAVIGPWAVKISPTRHAVSNLSLHLTTASGHQLFYSGDGLLSADGEQLAEKSNWVFLECETLTHHPSHGSWQDIACLSRKPDSHWYLYHIDPKYRHSLNNLISEVNNLSLAKEGEILDIDSKGNNNVA